MWYNCTNILKFVKLISSPLWRVKNAVFWRQLAWGLPFLAIFFPVVLLSFYALRIATDSVQQLLQTENIAATNSISQYLTEQFSEATGLVNAMATGSGTVTAVREQDRTIISGRLRYIVSSYPQISRAFVASTDGELWSEYPRSSRLLGSSIATQEWYYGLSQSGELYISGAYKRSDKAKDPVVAIAMPVRDEQGEAIGILVFEHNLKDLTQLVQTAQVANEGYVFVLDHLGVVISHPNQLEGLLSKTYKQKQPVIDALQGNLQTVEYTDPINKEEMVGTFVPVKIGENNWVITAQQPKANAYGQLRSITLNIGIVGSFLSLFTLFTVIALARTSAKNIKLNRTLETKNQKLRETALIVGASRDAIFGLNAYGKVQSWNIGAEEVYGYTEQQMINKSFTKLVPPDRVDELEKLLKRVRHDEVIKQHEMVHRRKDGRHIHVSLSLSAVQDEGEEVVGISAIARDISERTQIDQMKSDFISFVSHQLKAPITAIRWMIEGLIDGDDGHISSEQRQTLMKMQNVNASNYKLITDILNASRIERGVIAINTSRVSLHTIVNHAIENYKESCEKKGLPLRVEEIEPDIFVMADLDKAAESVGNSVSNAIKYADGGGVTIQILKDEQFGIVRVVDSGKGMSQETMGKLFKRDQVLGSNVDPDMSAGLGLYIGKHFMQLQDGDLQAASQLGRGSIFTYTLPLAMDGHDSPRTTEEDASKAFPLEG